MSKLPDEEVIALGKKIVKELDLEHVDTLGKWMAHYIAELIVKMETSDSTLKETLQIKCFETILKVWQHRNDIGGMETPLSNLEEAIEVLDNLREPDSLYPFFSKYKSNSSDPTWKSFTQLVKDNSTEILRLCIYSLLGEHFPEKKRQWIELNQELITPEEVSLIKGLDELKTNVNVDLNGNGETESVDSESEPPTPSEKFILAFQNMERLLAEQQNMLEELKKKIISGIGYE